MPDLAAAMVAVMTINSTLHTAYTPAEIMAMDDEDALLLRAGASALNRIIEWKRKKAKYE